MYYNVIVVMRLEEKMEREIKKLANGLMVAVAKTGVINQSNMEIAVEVMREELFELLQGSKYENERQALLLGSVHQNVVLSSVVLECVSRIRGQR
jgi:cytochrome c-type biogenesis protein CcmH/NrfF